MIEHLSEMMLFLNYRIFLGSAEALVRCGEKFLIAYFLGNMCAKHYENLTMLSRVTAKNSGGVFSRHSVQCVSKKTSPTFLAVTRESIVGFS